MYLRTAAASCFINLVIKESDNNIKLIVLDRLDTLCSKHGRILDGLIMDVLQVLSRYRFSDSCLTRTFAHWRIARTWRFTERLSALY